MESLWEKTDNRIPNRLFTIVWPNRVLSTTYRDPHHLTPVCFFSLIYLFPFFVPHTPGIPCDFGVSGLPSFASILGFGLCYKIPLKWFLQLLLCLAIYSPKIITWLLLELFTFESHMANGWLRSCDHFRVISVFNFCSNTPPIYL